MKIVKLISVAVLYLAAGIGFFASTGFSQTPSYLQTASVDAGAQSYTQSTTGPFSLTGQFTSAQTDIELLPEIQNGQLTLNGTSNSQVMTTGTTSSAASASSKAEYVVQINSSTSPSVPLDIVGTLLGSVGSAQGEASALVGFDEAAIANFDITTGAAAVNMPIDVTVTVPTNIPQLIELDTSVSLSGGFGTVSAQTDPYVIIDPSVPDPQQYQLTFVTTPVPEPASWIMLVGGLCFFLAVGGCGKFLGSTAGRTR
jgi:hypothetical protein